MARFRAMTQEEKQLLLQDICGRLPYGVIVHFDGWNPEKLTQVDLREFIFNDIGGIPIPYLRPMSSMTEEESVELSKIIGEWFDKELFYLTEEPFLEYALSKINYSISPLLFDWLNKKMFDYRGLIERNLAIDCSILNIYD